MRVAIIAVVLALAAPAVAQPNAAPNQQQLDRRERVKNRIRALRAYKLTEELSLDEATAGKLFPLLARYDNEFDRLLGVRADISKRLRQASRGPDARAADKLIDEAVANQRAFWDMEDKRLAELRKILSAQQTARLLVVLPPLERKIENQLRRAIAAKQPGGPGPGPGRRGAAAPSPPQNDDDDE